VKGGPFQVKPIICGRYFKLLVIRVTRPEKIAKMLELHIQFTKHTLKNCPTMESIYILAAGRGNISAAESLKTLLISELKEAGLNTKPSFEEKYKGLYEGRPHVDLYVCRLEIIR